MVNIIAAIGENNELGKENKLIWKLPKDMKFFKETTWEQTVVMGRKTFESLPKKLPHRKNVIITRQNLELDEDILCYHSILEVLDSLKEQEIFVIGGESIYEQFLPYTDNMYLTEVKAHDNKADAYFPNFDKEDWHVLDLESGIDNGLEYERKKYVRKKVK